MINIPLLSLLLLLLLASTESFKPGFSVGRITEGQFEYSGLNGWMTPRKARSICENDNKCGGFTYKGSKLLDREVQIYFFHILINIERDIWSWKWVYYTATKKYISFAGVFQMMENDSDTLRFVNSQNSVAEEECDNDPDCVAIVKTEDIQTSILLNYIDMDTFSPSRRRTTLIKVHNAGKESSIDANDSWVDLDLCCPKYDNVKQEKVLKTVNDRVERIRCDELTPAEFEARYVRQRRAVILVGCTSQWPASSWSPSQLLRDSSHLSWAVDFQTSLPGISPETPNLSGQNIIQIKESNGTVRIFDPISRRLHTNLRREGKTPLTDKMHLFSDYSAPQPIPRDLYDSAGILTDYQWVIISDKNTGTELHTDPDYTTPWNSVLSGHKWWVMLPHDVSPDSLLCDPDCSHEAEESDVNLGMDSWYSHVLPQIRNREFYGSRPQEFIQGPGETIYMPGSLAHAVLNIDNNLSITENYLLVDSIDDLVHGIMIGENAVGGDYNRKDEERLWKSLYFKTMGQGDREVMRAMRDQVEKMVATRGDICEEYDREMEEEEE